MQTEINRQEPSPSTRNTTLQVTGMTCGSCKRHIDAALSKLPGVESVRVDIPAQRVEIRHADATTVAKLVTAIEAEGYGARPV
jgi:copper chaperone CopZ